MKLTTREITLNVAHVENALISYLKPFFPEALEIEGVDIRLPVSTLPGGFQLAVYLRAKDNKDVVKDDTPKQQELPLESNVVEMAEAKKARE